jgi:hypothetical protein
MSGLFSLYFNNILAGYSIVAGLSISGVLIGHFWGCYATFSTSKICENAAKRITCKKLGNCLSIKK